MTTYCAPCLADLALVREAATSVSGTAACVAHAVLLTHPHDTPQRRLARLSELRAMAEGKLLTASAEDVPAIELLVQEYALAGAMDMTVPLKDLAGDRTPRPPKSRRDRGRDRARDGRPGERAPGERGPRPEAGTPDSPAEQAPPADVPAPDAPVASAEVATPAPESSGRTGEDAGAAPDAPVASAEAATPAPESSGRSGEESTPAVEAPVGE
jgi:hypothetical protein